MKNFFVISISETLCELFLIQLRNDKVYVWNFFAMPAKMKH